MDWMIELLLSYDAILVITDVLTKYPYFVPYITKTGAEVLAYWFMREIVVNYGAPEAIISDQDMRLMLKFWTSLMK